MGLDQRFKIYHRKIRCVKFIQWKTKSGQVRYLYKISSRCHSGKVTFDLPSHECEKLKCCLKKVW